MNVRAVIVASLLIGCSSSDSGPPLCAGATDPQACFTNHYLRGYLDDRRASCDGNTEKKIGGAKELVFHFSQAENDVATQADGRSLQHYFAPYELSFFTKGAARMVSFNYALEGDSATVAKRAQAEGVDPNDEAAMNRIAGDVVAANLRSFVNAQPRGENVVHIVVLPQVLSPALAKELTRGGTIVGLGLSPALLSEAAADDPNKNLFELFGLPDDFTPVLFIGHEDVVRLGRGTIGELVAAHELGHALGLAHTNDPQNLMYPRLDATRSCVLGLTDAQVDSLDAVTLQAAPRYEDGHRVAAALVRKLARRQ